MSTFLQMVANMASGWASLGIRLALSLLTVPLLLGHLGVETYGLIGLFATVLGLADLIDLGLRQALSRELAAHVAGGDWPAFSRTTSTAMAIYMTLAVLFTVAVVAAAPGFLALLNVAPAARPEAVRYLRWMAGFSVPMTFAIPVFSAGLMSLDRFDVANAAGAASNIVCGVAIVGLVGGLRAGLIGWVAAMILGQAVQFLLVARRWRMLLPKARMHWADVDWSSAGPLYRLGWHIYMMQWAQFFMERVHPFVLSRMMGPAAVAVFAPARKLSECIQPLVGMMSGQLSPMATRHFVENDRARLRRVLILGTKHTVLPGLVVAVLIAGWSSPFCHLWLSASLGESSRITAMAMVAWTVVDALNYWGGSQWAILLAAKRIRLLSWISLALGLASVALSVVLIRFTDLGVMGVMVSIIAVHLIRRPIVTILALRCVGIGWGEYFTEAYLRALLAGAITALTVVAVRWMLPVRGWGDLVLGGVLTTVIATGSAIWIGLGTEEWGMLRRAWSAGTAKLRHRVLAP